MTQEQLNNLLDLGKAFGPSILQGIAGAGQAGANRALQEKQLELQKQQQIFQNLLSLMGREDAARSAQADFYSGRGNRDLQRAIALASADPLGAEQSFAAKQNMLFNSSNALKGQTAPSYGGTVNPFANMDTSIYGQDATAASIANRRRILAAIAPNVTREGIQGLGDQTARDKAVTDFQNDMLNQKNLDENATLDILNNQLKQAQTATGNYQAQLDAAAAAQTSAQPEPKKPGFWSKLGRGLMKIAPIAAMAIPGLGPVASTLLQTGLGATSGAMGGGGWKGALTGGALSAAFPVKGAPVGSSVGANLKNAILNPQTLARAGSAFAGKAEPFIDAAAGAFLNRNPFPVAQPATPALTAPQMSGDNLEYVMNRVQTPSALTGGFYGTPQVGGNELNYIMNRVNTPTSLSAPTAVRQAIDAGRGQKPSTPWKMPIGAPPPAAWPWGQTPPAPEPIAAAVLNPQGPAPIPIGEEWRQFFRPLEAANLPQRQQFVQNQATNRAYWTQQQLGPQIAQLERTLAQAKSARPAAGSGQAVALWRRGQQEMIRKLEAQLAQLKLAQRGAR